MTKNRSTLAYIANMIPRRDPFTGEDTLITGKRTDGQLFHVRVTTSIRFAVTVELTAVTHVRSVDRKSKTS